MKNTLIYLMMAFIFFSMKTLACEITIYGLGKENRLFTCDEVQCIHDIWNASQVSEKILYEKDLQKSGLYSRYVTVYRNGSIYIIDMFACNKFSFPLRDNDILLFSKTPFYHESLKEGIDIMKSNLPPRCIYPITRQQASEICNYLLEYISNLDVESPTTEYYRFYKKIADIPSSKQYRFYHVNQMDKHMKNLERDLRYDDIILAILKTFPEWDKLYEIHLLSPCCARMINKNTGAITCYGLYKDKLEKSDNNINFYYNLHLTETSFQCSDITNHALIKHLVAMEIYLGADERIISITCKNDKFYVTIKTPCENELYILEHNFPPRRCGQYGDENIR